MPLWAMTSIVVTLAIGAVLCIAWLIDRLNHV